MFYFTCNHAWNWNKAIPAAERVLELFQNYFSDTEHVWKYSWAAISLMKIIWNNLVWRLSTVLVWFVSYGSFSVFLLCLGCTWCFVSLFFDCLKRLVSKMTCYVSSGTLNPTHSLTHSFSQLAVAYTYTNVCVYLLYYYTKTLYSLCCVVSWRLWHQLSMSYCSDCLHCVDMLSVSSILSMAGRSQVRQSVAVLAFAAWLMQAGADISLA